jgi:hypothetical protein
VNSINPLNVRGYRDKQHLSFHRPHSFIHILPSFLFYFSLHGHTNTMSANADTRPSLGESIDAGLPFYAPPLQADVLSPEEFDKEFDKLDTDRCFQQYCASLLDATTWVPTPPTLTWSPQSSYKPTTSRHSPNFALSDCLRASEGLSVHDSIQSDVAPTAAQSFGFLPPSLYHAGTQSDNGACGSTDLHQPAFEMSLHDLSAALQQSVASVTPTPLPTQSTLEPQTNTSTVKQFPCHFCGLCKADSMKIYIRLSLFASLKAQVKPQGAPAHP